jgi:glycosyltransferase involved in cell wall biosynthesis
LISTAMGVEGLAVTDGVDILMAEDPAAFAAQTVKLLRSPDLRRRLAAGGRRLVERRYDWAVLGGRLAGLVEELASARAAVSLARATPAVRGRP